MPRILKKLKWFLRKITCRQKQPETSPAVPSTSITPEIPSDTSPIPPAALPASIAPENSSATSPIPSTAPSATGSDHVQEEQSRDSPQQPPAAQSLWDQAYDALAKKMPGLVKDYDELLAKELMATDSAPNETTPPPLPAPHGLDTRSDRSRRLDTVIQNGLKRMEDNKTTFMIAGHEFVLKTQIAKAAKFLLWGKDLIGSAVKNSPEASIVWSGVSLIFPLLTNPTTADEANRDGFSYVTSRMRYYAALEPMLRRLGRNAGVDEALVSVANGHIVDLYQAILEFQLSSVIRFYRGHFKTYVYDIVPSKNWEQTRLDIEKLEGTVNDNLGQINGLVERQELELLNKTSEDTHTTMKECLSVATQQLAVISEQLTVLKQQQAAEEDAKRERLLAMRQQQAAQEAAKQERLLAEQRTFLRLFYLSQNGKGATYDWYKGRVELRIEGTCEWFLKHKNFERWLSQESGPLLVSADPGCGKSVLAKYLIDHELAQQSATICYFFFKDQDQNTICQALRALLHQLFRQKSALIRHAMDLYNVLDAGLVESETSLWTILKDAVRDPEAGPIIFVIDALDECAKWELGSLITNLSDIFCDQQFTNAKFKVLMTSRPYQRVVSEFYSLQDDFRHIRIPGEEEFEALSQEINSVIHYRVEQLAKKHELSDKIKSSLLSKLLAIDHRTYLWVHLVFDYLEEGFNMGSKKTDNGINAAIHTLPKSVNQAYDQILNRSRKDETAETVKKALCIILAAHRPLTLSEMNIAINLNGQDRVYDLDLDQDEHFESRLRNLCGLFVHVHHGQIYFLHQTAREFLLQSSAPATVSSDLQWHHSITIRQAHSVLAEICMFYVDMATSKETTRPGVLQHNFWYYSARQWSDHCREADFEKGSPMMDLALELCTPDSTSHPFWAEVTFRKYFISSESPPNVLVASHLGFTSIIELLLSRGADIEAGDRSGETALMYAAESGHEAASQLLLDNGAKIEAKTAVGETALMHAAKFGHETVARLLLENGANIEAKHDRGWTALMFAADAGREAVTRLLLENGADVETRHSQGTTALIFAARFGDEAVTRLLLDNGAVVEAENNCGMTALLSAARYGHEAVIRLLLRNGADVETRNSQGMTALILAAKFGDEAVTRLLLDNGADVEARDNKGWTALKYASVTTTGRRRRRHPDVACPWKSSRKPPAKIDYDTVRQLLFEKAGVQVD